MKRGILIVLTVLVVSFVVSFALSFFSQYIEQQNTVQRIKGVRLEQQEEAKRRLIDPDYRNESMLPAMRRQADEIESLKNSVAGSNAVILDAISGIVQKMVLAVAEYESADKEASTVFDFSTIHTPADVAAAIEIVEQAEKVSNILDQTIREMGPKLKEALSKRRVKPSDIESAMQSFYRTADVKKKSELYKMNAEVWKEAKQLLLILKKEWGTWKYDEVEGGVIFDSDSTVTEFNNVMERISDLARKMEKLQYTILKNQAGEGS